MKRKHYQLHDTGILEQTFSINEIDHFNTCITLHKISSYLIQVPTLCNSIYEEFIQFSSKYLNFKYQDAFTKYPKKLLTKLVQEYRKIKLFKISHTDFKDSSDDLNLKAP